MLSDGGGIKVFDYSKCESYRYMTPVELAKARELSNMNPYCNTFIVSGPSFALLSASAGYDITTMLESIESFGIGGTAYIFTTFRGKLLSSRLYICRLKGFGGYAYLEE